MITWLIIGIILFVIKMIGVSFKAAWSITKALIYVLVIPIVLICLLIAGILSVAVPLLIIALLGAFLIPVFKKH